jgi:asparagine synthase (glutamine-hydrolysing)
VSAILAIVTPRGGEPRDGEVLEMLGAMRRRGGDVRQVVRRSGVVLAVARYGWELGEGFAGSTLVAEDGDLVVAADASLYYREELRSGLRSAGLEVEGTSAAELILAAYRAWGAGCLDRLEGDFAFAVWDDRRRRMLAARDFVGSRPLFHAGFGGRFVVASTIGGIRAARGFPDELDPVALANLASLFLGNGEETCYRAVSALRPGHRLEFDATREAASVQRWWSTPEFAGEARPALRFEEAAEHLRELLQRATEERCPAGEPLAVTLSGGWDSPAVYAAVHAVCRGRGEPGDLVRPVSLTYPEGDPGREDGLIAPILARFGQTTHWIDTELIPLLGGVTERARTHDEPFAHPFEGVNAALGQGARDVGSRLCFTGVGGDQLFGAELAYLSDLLAGGHFAALARELRAERIGARTAADWMIRPRLSRRSLQGIGFLRGGKPPLAHMERRLPPWIRSDFAARHDLAERERLNAPVRRRGERVEGFERRWLIEHGLYARMICESAELSLARGAEHRMPLIDGRVVAFAATRPREERRSGRETKRLLRNALADWLPPIVLAPRPTRTGTMGSYFGRSLKRELGHVADPLFRDPVLAELGIVDRDRLCAAAAALESGATGPYDGAMVLTLRAEAWLRARREGQGPYETETESAERREVAADALTYR